MDTFNQQIFEFGEFRLDAGERLLSHNGAAVSLTPKAFETLLVLVQNHGHVLTREQLLNEVWRDAFVEENTLTQNIAALRRALSERQNARQYIETVPKVGYRFVAGVRELGKQNGEMLIARRTRERLVIKAQEAIVDRRDADELTIVRQPPSLFEMVKQRRRLILAISTFVLFAVVTTALITANFSTPVASNPPIKSIAVLPFQTLDTSEREAYLGLGMADTLITKISNIGQIKIRPTSAIRKYSDQEQDSLAAGREQRVDAVLEGSIQRSGDKMRVTVRLLSVRDGSPLWAYRCDEVCTDLFDVQDLITEQVAGALTLKLTGQEKARLTQRHTESLEAYQAYLKGRYFWNKRTPEDFKKAAEHFQQAITIDPNYALGYAGLADCYFFNGEGAKTLEALSKALELDDQLVEAITTQAYYLSVRWDWASAETLFKRAIELNPNYPPAHHWYAFHLAALGRFPEAIEEINRAKELDPLSLIINTDVGHILYFSRQYDQAIEAYRRVLEMEPNFSVGRWRLGEAYEQKGMVEEAIAEYQKALSLSKNPTIEVWLGHTYAVSGKKDKAHKILGELVKIHKRDPRWFYEIALIYEGLGDRERAFEWLEKAFENKEEASLALLKAEPMLDSLRADRRFTELLNRIGLVE
ncbi:MAG: tetratricopeptide repeat protein [Acidobacteriota bacterium]